MVNKVPTAALAMIASLVAALVAVQEARAGDCRVVLVPGAFGKGTSSRFLSQRDYFGDYIRFFGARGCRVLKVEFPSDGTIEVRAILLREQLQRFLKQNPGDPALLIGHSQGGLDARYALHAFNLKEVGCLITVGTPHHGTILADWTVKQRESGSLLYWILRWGAGYDFRALPFAGEMTTGFVDRHGVYFAAVPGVKYASARGVCRKDCHWSLRILSRWIGLGEGDGIMGGETQRFGEDLGEFDLDHISEVGADSAKTMERARLLRKIAEYAHLN